MQCSESGHTAWTKGLCLSVLRTFAVQCVQETFLDLMLPVVSATIKHFELQQEQTSGLHPRVRKALRRRERLKARPRVEGESDAVFKVCASLCLSRARLDSLTALPSAQRGPLSAALFDGLLQGFTTRDRRKPHIQEADAAAEAVAAMTDAEGVTTLSCFPLLVSPTCRSIRR